MPHYNDVYISGKDFEICLHHGMRYDGFVEGLGYAYTSNFTIPPVHFQKYNPPGRVHDDQSFFQNGFVQYLDTSPKMRLMSVKYIYKVKAGDTLTSISAKFGISIQSIKDANAGIDWEGERRGDRIFAGEELELPRMDEVRQVILENQNRYLISDEELPSYSPGEIRPYEPGVIDKFLESGLGCSVVGQIIYGVIDDLYITAQCLTVGHPNALHLNGELIIGNEIVNSGINTISNFVPFSTIGKSLGISKKVLNVSKFNSVFKGTGVNSAKYGGRQIRNFNNTIRFNNSFNRDWGKISAGSMFFYSYE
jgi:hypothetical protein